MHPATLEKLGLVAALRGFCQEFALAHALAVEFTCGSIPEAVPEEMALCLYRIRRLLEPRCEIVGTAADGHALIDLATNTRPDVIVLDISMPRLNGLALLAEAERLNPDVIVLDITMPGLDGIEAARRLRNSRHPARLVFLTVHERPEFARAALDAGGLAYVIKPRLASDLVPAIRAALADRRFISPTISLQENA